MPIPASAIVNIIPGVLGAGGNPLSLNGLILSIAAVLPAGPPVAFASAALVSTYFGPTSQEALMAATYFGGFTNSTAKPSSLLFSAYAKVATSAFTRGAANTLTLAQVQALIPSVTAATTTIAATVMTVATVSSGLLVPGMILTGGTMTAGTRIVNQLTGPVGGAGTYTVSISQTLAAAAVTGAFDMAVTINGVLFSSASINLSAATSFSNAATLIQAALVLAGGSTMTYASNFAAYTITSGTTGAASTITLASGALADQLNMSTLLGGIMSQGSAISVPATVLNAIINVNQNWSAFTTAFEPDASSAAYTVKTAIAVWTSAQNGRYLYCPWDANPAVATANGAVVSTLGQYLPTATLNGTMALYAPAALDPNGLVAAFTLGAIAAINFNQTNGRIALAYKQGSGVPVTVTDITTYNNVIGNGYSGYGTFATANQSFSWFFNGAVSGPYLWTDAYINAVYLNSQLQLGLMVLFQTTTSIPYSNLGYAQIKAACQPAIDQMVTFGGIRSGVPLTPLQVSQVNAAAGLPIDNILVNRGWYLQVLPASAATRILRQSPPITLWYNDGSSVQALQMASIDVQ